MAELINKFAASLQFEFILLRSAVGGKSRPCFTFYVVFTSSELFSIFFSKEVGGLRKEQQIGVETSQYLKQHSIKLVTNIIIVTRAQKK